MKHRNLTLKLVVWAVAMFGFGYALVPLYSVFCQITGLNGKTANVKEEVKVQPDLSRTIRVEFVAAVPEGAPWEFHPDVGHMEVHPGQLYEAQYFARNLTARPLTGQAVPSVSPGEAAKYFKKTQCFCFTQQNFAANEGREMKVVFSVDPNLPKWIDTLTLGYTFFALDEPN
ncbi:MAG TPA: cytochrome c oxidase assembly protein [Gammaproteobacteria bacterium]|nr:cytochrome c oxidase assembly protein [Gammaproteobacteria bacterium]